MTAKENKIPGRQLCRRPREQAVQIEVDREFQEGCFRKGGKMELINYLTVLMMWKII